MTLTPGDRIVLPNESGRVRWVSSNGEVVEFEDDDTREICWRKVADVVAHYPKEGRL